MRRATYLILALAVLPLQQAVAETVCGPVRVAAPSAGGNQPGVEAEVCSQVNAKFQTGNFSGILAYMAKAQSVAAAGRVADYASNMSVFSLGAGTTVAVSNVGLPTSSGDIDALSKRLSNTTVPDLGSGFSASATLGVSLRTTSLRRRGFFDPKNLNLYLSFFVLPTLAYSGYTMNMTSGSLYLQYKLLQPRRVPLALLTWGGLDLGLGYTYASSKFVASSAEKLASISFVYNSLNILYEPTGSLGITYATHVVPLELSTNFSILHFLSMVIGGAADFHLLAQADLTADVSGAVKVNGVSTAGDFARFSSTESGRAETVVLRAFGGPQFNIWKVRVFTLVHATNNQTYGLTLGARFTW
jgi:hypothetical protein